MADRTHIDATGSTGSASGQVAEVFAIGYGDTVSDGVPGHGAGNIEGGGNEDVYTFQGNAGDLAIFDVLAGPAGTFRWDANSPDGTDLFDGIFNDRRAVLPQTGTYSVGVRGANGATTGTYSFRLLLAPPPERFVISFEDTVSEDVPAAGAGNVEGPGALDIYNFDAVAGQIAIFDLLAGDNVRLGWRLEAPNGTTLFDTFVGDRQVTLPTTGTYSLTVGGNGIDDSGTYSFQLLEAPPNTAPAAADDAAETNEGVAVTVDVLANDSDADGDALVIDAISQPGNGTAVLQDGAVTYTPAAGFVGIDSFTYTVVDGRGGSAEATVTVTVREVAPLNQPPTIGAIADQENVEGDVIALAVAAEDPDGGVLTFSADGLPTGLTIDATTGEINGTIAAGAAGGSSFMVEVTVTDSDGAIASTEFGWTVRTTPVWVEVDVVPRKIVNDGHGLILVVIFGDADVDARRIDARTVELEGMPVATVLGKTLALRLDANRDGYQDLIVLIDDVAGAMPAGTTTVTVTALLRDGTEIAGTDEVRVVSGRFRARHRG
jgi:hypothetical protein